MCDQGLKDWQLRLVGGMVSKDKPFLNRLKKKAAGYPIEFQTNLSLTSLKQNYARAKIYWHAAGFGEKETKHPERMEHFGITTVEAMAAGAVPVVVAQGGQPEIVKDKTTGLLWQTKAELVQKTLQLIDSPKLWQKLSSAAIKESQKFDQKIFVQKFDEIIQV
jgi:glycosyltransferase involved in cell wall biosynthesis